jgi:hypothetical protein
MSSNDEAERRIFLPANRNTQSQELSKDLK